MISVRGAITDAAAAIGHLGNSLVLHSSTSGELEFPLRGRSTIRGTRGYPSLLILFQAERERERGENNRGSAVHRVDIFHRFRIREIATEKERGVPGSLTRPRDRILEWPRCARMEFRGTVLSISWFPRNANDLFFVRSSDRC